MTSIDELITGLRAILRQVEIGRARLHDAAANRDAASATYSATLRASHSPAAASLTRTDTVARRQSHQDGSEYPPEADWAVATLPTRVGVAGQRATTGRVKIGDRVIPGEFRSGEWDSWVDRAWDRFKEVGKADRAGAFLKFHVESRA
jgi:hypothetical protein